MTDLQADVSPSAAVSAARAVVIGLTAFLTLVDLFAAQALLPMLAHAYDVSPAAMGVAVNASTFGMAVSSLAVALVSRRMERRRGIWISLAALSVPTALLAVAPSLTVFAALRVVQGIFMAAAFALTLAYLGEHFSARNSANAFAAYVTGNVASNLFGRLLAAAMADHFGVAAAFYLFALLNLAGALLVYAKPLPTRATAGAGNARFADWIGRLRNPTILSCLGVGFCILFAFIGTFTYINFVLVTPPFELGMMSLGFVYLVFLPSIITTPLGGHIAKRFGTRATLWITLGLAGLGLMLLLTHSLSIVVVGLALVGIGTFLAQAAATGFMSAAATFDRGVASGLYLASYFFGGLMGSVVLGQLYVRFGWPACVAGIGGALVIAALLGSKLTLRQRDTLQAEMLPRHGTDSNSAMATVAQLGDAQINGVRN
jgi:MFS transporter, YNFM family, putative membrane transport protein